MVLVMVTMVIMVIYSYENNGHGVGYSDHGVGSMVTTVMGMETMVLVTMVMLI